MLHSLVAKGIAVFLVSFFATVGLVFLVWVLIYGKPTQRQEPVQYPTTKVPRPPATIHT